jgi:hypothetical protein
LVGTKVALNIPFGKDVVPYIFILNIISKVTYYSF